MLNIFCSPIRYVVEDVRSLSLPGTYHEKIDSLGISLRRFTRLKHLDLSRNAIDNLEVCKNGVLGKLLIYLGVRRCLKDFGSKYEEKTGIGHDIYSFEIYFSEQTILLPLPILGKSFSFYHEVRGSLLDILYHISFLFLSYVIHLYYGMGKVIDEW